MSAPEEVKLAVRTALEAGYTHIDTAYVYQNEIAIGETLQEMFKEGKIKREDLFIVTKLPANGMRTSDVKYFLEKSLARLQLSYVDLYLVHTCIGFQRTDDDVNFSKAADGTPLLDMSTDLVAVWKEMERMVELGLTKSIGVSNWSVEQIQRILDAGKIKPANHQVELHAYFQQDKMVDFCHKNGITVCAYCPLGSPGRPAFMARTRGLNVEVPDLLGDPVVLQLAKKYSRPPANILLRFLMQRGIVVIPKSVTPARIKANLQVFDFHLEADDFEALRKLDRNHRIVKLTTYVKEVANHPEYRGYQ